ncbi:MAG TPA: hypothetical protein VIQ97_01180, partial [Prevotella sp.]
LQIKATYKSGGWRFGRTVWSQLRGGCLNGVFVVLCGLVLFYFTLSAYLQTILPFHFYYIPIGVIVATVTLALWKPRKKYVKGTALQLKDTLIYYFAYVFLGALILFSAYMLPNYYIGKDKVYCRQAVVTNAYGDEFEVIDFSFLDNGQTYFHNTDNDRNFLMRTDWAPKQSFSTGDTVTIALHKGIFGVEVIHGIRKTK